MSSHGLPPEPINVAFRRAVTKRLLHRAPEVESSEARDPRYRITTAGAYAYKKLVGMFVYIDAIIVDTPIMDRDAAPHIARDVSAISERLVRAERFRQYLDAAWSDMGPGKAAPFSWPDASATLSYDIVRIGRRVDPTIWS